MNFPISISGTNLFQFLGVLGGFFIFIQKVIIELSVRKSGDLDQTPRYAASDLGLC